MRSLLHPLRTLFRPSRSWHYSFGYDHVIDFCLWVLERDGLSAPPFDRHPAGDGTLQSAGLDAAGWWTWYVQVVGATGEQHRNRFGQRWPPPPLQPAALWDGPPAVGRRLAEMAEEFEDVWDERKGDTALDHAFDACDRPLWKALAPYRRKLPPVRVVTVGYPGPVQVEMAPDTIVLAVGTWQPEPSELAAAILRGMRDLTAATSSRTSFRDVR